MTAIAVPEGLTPTQRRIYSLLVDGLPHPYEELYRLLNDDMAGDGVVAVHVHKLRAKLEREGVTIAHFQRAGYRLVRLMSNPYDGRK